MKPPFCTMGSYQLRVLKASKTGRLHQSDKDGQYTYKMEIYYIRDQG